MAWIKAIKGDFGAVRAEVDTLADDIRAGQEKAGVSGPELEAAHAQARVAQLAVSELTARHAGEEAFAFALSGESAEKGGSLSIQYSFGAAPVRKKKKR